ncbi:unnamed protein product [Polarella glacialis]|uniref:Uncharacterized protein n=1 Tax=Polarella glacialis TaxID=89957 RepID=A0A813I3T8_POLGL|nr:unnamed protein product [Polarella glacialis]CAE8645623.1 unnamed protein product [Polarella glacialis]CAE8648421.1 unnamed protein product [Polarella glacialis]
MGSRRIEPINYRSIQTATEADGHQDVPELPVPCDSRLQWQPLVAAFWATGVEMPEQVARQPAGEGSRGNSAPTTASSCKQLASSESTRPSSCHVAAAPVPLVKQLANCQQLQHQFQRQHRLHWPERHQEETLPVSSGASALSHKVSSNTNSTASKGRRYLQRSCQQQQQKQQQKQQQ